MRGGKAKAHVADPEREQLRIGYRTRNVILPERQRRHLEIRQQAFFQAVEIGHGGAAQVEFAARPQRPDVVEFEDDLLVLVFGNGKGRLIINTEPDAAELVANFQLRCGGEGFRIIGFPGSGLLRDS